MSKITVLAELQSITISYSYKTVYINFKTEDNIIANNKILLKPKSVARIKYKFNSHADLKPLNTKLGNLVSITQCPITFDISQFDNAEVKNGLLIPQFTTEILE